MRLDIMPYPTPIRQELNNCIQTTLNVLNQYLDITSPLSLQYAVTPRQYDTHPCVDTIAEQLSTSKTPLRTTRRRAR